ncbi:MAG: DUF5060 domain-containing protein [Isosphaeraceae bacterium]|nr:DUF5060 domain-containing protein [Isosphaeraceae bacterium]
MVHRSVHLVLGLQLLTNIAAHSALGAGAEIGRGGVYSVVELDFRGPRQGPADVPARDIDFWVLFRHESGSSAIKVHGYWDGDGRSGTSGDVFKIRFCPIRPGRWDLAEVHSSAPELDRQHQGDHITATASDHPGFWLVDTESPGHRWYRRSDGSHPYIIGNTHYSFLSGYRDGGRPTGRDIAEDVARNAAYFKKLRFGLQGDRYPHPTEKPFLDDQGRPTDDGDHSHRPNPRWFRDRVDRAVRAAYDHDLIADLILCGPDTGLSRSTLRARHNGGDPTPYLKSIAARYGSYPNVWICLCNEYDIKRPRYSEEEVARFGRILRGFLPYPTPLSVHPSTKPWSAKFDALPPWNDHQIIQRKLRQLGPAADAIRETWSGPQGGAPRHRPTIDDELSYQGEGDRHNEGDTVASHLGAFLGGGYGTTGEKSANKVGQYFWGRFDPSIHTAADNLKWLRDTIDTRITFWRMAPDEGIFTNLDPGSRGLAWPGREYVLGTDKARRGIIAQLPPGTWTVVRFDVMAREEAILSREATGRFTFDAPDGRAVLFHFKKNGDSNAFEPVRNHTVRVGESIP